MDIESVTNNLRQAANELALHSAQKKNNALKHVCASIARNKDKILQANNIDVEKSREKGMSEALVERLALDEKKFQSMLSGIETIISQTDPIGEQTSGWNMSNGATIRQVRCPLGIVAIIYESRPNVTVDAFALAYKSGNAILLRGSSSALNSNKALVQAIQEGLEEAKDDGIKNAVYLCESTDHSDVDQILTAVGRIDVVLPRGGAKLIQHVTENAKIPVIETGSGICHLYVDDAADCEMAARIAKNSKTQRPGACNAIETLLVHQSKLKEFLPLLAKELDGKVELRADKESHEVLAQASYSNLKEAADDDFGYEFLDFILAVKTVGSIEEAITFINTHNTKHSEAIITNDRSHARMFQSKVDAACVYVNASTRFTDGGEFGFGAELGISTQKLHARGPMGIRALTTTKFLIDGDGQIR